VSLLEDLRRVDLFEDLTDAELEDWAAVAEPRDAEDEEVLLEQGVLSPGLLLLFDGKANARMNIAGRIEPGNENVGPTWIGAIAALTEDALPITLVAAGPCRIAMVPREAFVDLALTHRSVHRHVMRVIGPVMRGINQRESSRERLTSLGTMAAGLAHELNNPAAAARRAAGDLIEAVETISHALEAFVESGIEREDAEKLLVLQREAMERGAARGPLDAMDASDAEDAMLDALEDCGVPEPWKLAEPLGTAGLDKDWLTRLNAIAGDATPKALKWVAASLTARGLANELLESADRMSHLVKAVKSYAYMDRGDVVIADVHEGLESTLIMLGHKLKHTHIKIKRDYDKTLPKLTLRGSELNQVWTNVLDNAIGALGEEGTISIKTLADNGCVRVDIADDGPGIPPEVAKHVFDPFFTTKPPGSGTGMGLDTARRIVEQRHRGSLTFDTDSGGTTFHIWLPVEDTTQ
jgi:signal transduction histidine kinase